MVVRSATLFLPLLALACKRDSPPPPAVDAGADAGARVPAPNSVLARELGTDDAGRGEYRFYDDGPWCGFAVRVNRKKPLDAHDTFGFFETESVPRDGPREDAQVAPIKLVLAGAKRVFPEEPLSLVLTLVNGSTNPLQYMKAVDGSFEHWRAPFVDLYARDEKSGRTYRWAHGDSYGRCGSMDPPKPEDFAVVPAGQRRTDPFGRSSQSALKSTLTKPGKYTLWVVYAACAGPERGSPRGVEDAPPPDVFDGTIASNGIAIEVVPHR
jgi:hypothetical protein